MDGWDNFVVHVRGCLGAWSNAQPPPLTTPYTKHTPEYNQTQVLYAKAQRDLTVREKACMEDVLYWLKMRFQMDVPEG